MSVELQGFAEHWAVDRHSQCMKLSHLLAGPAGTDTIHVCLTSDDADLRSAAVVVRSVRSLSECLQSA